MAFPILIAGSIAFAGGASSFLLRHKSSSSEKPVGCGMNGTTLSKVVLFAGLILGVIAFCALASNPILLTGSLLLKAVLTTGGGCFLGSLFGAVVLKGMQALS